MPHINLIKANLKEDETVPLEEITSANVGPKLSDDKKLKPLQDVGNPSIQDPSYSSELLESAANSSSSDSCSQCDHSICCLSSLTYSSIDQCSTCPSDLECDCSACNS